MAVQKSKKTRSRRDMRRSHNQAKGSKEVPAYSIDSSTGERHLRHHISPNGYYRGKQVMKIKVRDIPEEDDES